MNKEFQTHLLNQAGITKSQAIADAFDRLLRELTDPRVTDPLPLYTTALCPPGRETSILRTKLEEACFFAKKAMASGHENQIIPGNGCAPPIPATEAGSTK